MKENVAVMFFVVEIWTFLLMLKGIQNGCVDASAALSGVDVHSQES